MGKTSDLIKTRIEHAGGRYWAGDNIDRKSTRLNSSHGYISYAVFCLKKKKTKTNTNKQKQKKKTTQKSTYTSPK